MVEPVCSTDAVLLDTDARVGVLASAVQSAYGLSLTHADGEMAYRSEDDTLKVNVQGSEHLRRPRDKGDDLVLLVPGGEPSAS